ncbi:dGTPase [Actinopolyspora xinjiangensis]|uniref:Deoxyguanosinetriphosphate triphosphohydrolase-like protein n=1 Tax=Actinopolyspora xinjiangensis TaxID=405564 RepID=A0A1H0UCM0_9ACTN|nr:deoxyguanosinetriphosphate triphosphohydrolase [Actinopolyspora xinjiangensis]SDP63924.1 dGTPase [Actinopolyspora xinjiangensis]
MSESEPPGYTEHDRQRLLDEPPKVAESSDGEPLSRSPFARDRARVLHSAALRRLAGKTQVMGPEEGDVPRTRLTHSLEVAQIGRAIALDLGADPDVVDTAGLAHDIGHPPFGHNGEHALAELAADCGGFEGNAQTLRILTRLEPKSVAPDGTGCGLNLTRACLDAATKYPWPLSCEAGGKFGVYESDLAVFRWFRRAAPAGRRCLEAQIMDWADDVAYSVHDLEDGVHTGRISPRALLDSEERGEILRIAGKYFRQQRWLDAGLLESAASELVTGPALAAVLDYDGSVAAQVGLKRLTSELVGRFVSAAVRATRAEFGSGPLIRYTADLVVPEQVAAEVAVLKAMALRYVMSDPERLRLQQYQRRVLTELVNALVERAPASLTPAAEAAWEAAPNDRARLRAVLDQVASFTDAQAVSWHARWVFGTDCSV